MSRPILTSPMNLSDMREKSKRVNKLPGFIAVLLCTVLLGGCGRMVMTRGFRDNQICRVGNRVLSEDELRVYFLDLEKQCCRMFGDDALDGDDNESLREDLRQKGISEASRVLALKQLAIKDNIMLTSKEEELCRKAGNEFYDSLSDAEKSYIGMKKSHLQNMYMDYALADKTYRSLGSGFEKAYDSFTETLDSDLNKSLWDTITVQRVDGDDKALSFSEMYEKYFN